MQITQLVEQKKLPFLFVDSGSLLFQHKRIQAKKEQAEKAKAEGLAAAMQAMNCRALGIGAHDLADGVDFLKKLQERHKDIWVSMNLVDPEKKTPLFTPYLITQVGGLKIAVLGLTDDQGEHDSEGKKKGYTLLPWQTVLPKTLRQIAKKVDMTILLSSYSYQVNKEIAEAVDDLDMILESGHAGPTAEPYRIKDTLIAQTGTRGKYLGMMQIEWNETGQWTEKSFARIRTEENSLKQVKRQLARMEKQKTKAVLAKDRVYKKLSAEKRQLTRNIKTLKKRRDSVTEKEGMCTYTNRFIPLHTSLPEDPEIKKIIHQAIDTANEINKKRIAKVGENDPTISLQDLAGSEKCRDCHAAQMTVWQDSQHAHAWETLEKKNQQFNDDCLICHVTLPFYDADKVKAGNLLLMLSKSLKKVGCEACHGPAAAHSAGQGKIPTARPDEKICLQCHTPEHDDHFVFSEKVKRLACSSKQKQKQEKNKEEQKSSQPTASEPTAPPEITPTITPHGKKVRK
ncbi:MAG: hypothetical protein D3904_02665 [Candidatus Electrothrix sp. EH2]|nr:hypothetical protein [Candidatus Electrothrix sp. EH2]